MPSSQRARMFSGTIAHLSAWARAPRLESIRETPATTVPIRDMRSSVSGQVRLILRAGLEEALLPVPHERATVLRAADELLAVHFRGLPGGSRRGLFVHVRDWGLLEAVVCFQCVEVEFQR